MKRIATILATSALGFALVAGTAARADEPKKDDGGSTQGTVKSAAKTFWEDTKAVGRTIRDSKTGQAVAGAGKEVGHAAADVGRKVGTGAVEAGKDTADVSKDVWSRTKKASIEMAHSVRDATVSFWNGVIRGKETEAAKLRKENEALKSTEKSE